MKLSTIALGLLMTGMVFSQKSDNPASQADKTAAEKSQTNAQEANASNTGKGGSASELKTQTYKGTLVDAACGGGASSTSAGQSAADGEKSSAGASAAKGDAKGSANRSANGGSSCNVSSSSGQFALQTKDGRTLRFDAVGNERAKQELLNRKSWTNATSAGKPIRAKVSGAETGDSLLVVSIH